MPRLPHERPNPYSKKIRELKREAKIKREAKLIPVIEAGKLDKELIDVKKHLDFDNPDTNEAAKKRVWKLFKDMTQKQINQIVKKKQKHCFYVRILILEWNVKIKAEKENRYWESLTNR
jgi:hypothetical protein